ncbi:MAG: tetratricopeptide repeat protein [Rhizomicrobium sp.]
MKLFRDSLILSFAALALSPALAAPSHLPVKAAPGANVDRAVQLMHEAEDARGKGDKALAYRMGEAAIVADPARPSAYDLLGNLYAQDSDADFARFYYNEALSIDPNDPGAMKAMAQLDHGATREAQEASPAGK